MNSKLVLIEAFEKAQEALRQQAQDDLLAFTLYTKRDYQVNWHNRILCQKLDDFAKKKIRNLIIEMPPRHGKSEIGSRRLPAYIFGKFPTTQIISASYASDLASRMNRDVQRIIDDKFYNEVFPDTALGQSNVVTVAKGTWLRNSEIFEIVDHAGIYRCAGVGGGITGMGANYLMIDDPIKNHKEANSKTVRNSIWEWYTSTARSRLQKGGSTLIIMTRWHEDDLAGRLLDLAKKDPNADQWEVVSFPAVKETNENPDDPREIGEALWPEEFPIEELKKTEATAGPRVWNSLYQQRPSAMEGNVISRKDIQFYMPEDLPDRFQLSVHSWDFTFKETQNSDYVVGTAWGAKGGNFYLLDQIRDRMGFTKSKEAIRKMISRYPKYNSILVEEKANGAAIIEVLKRDISRIIPINPQESKAARFEAVSPLFAAHNVWFPDPSWCPWIEEFIEELLSFPNAAFDDRVDSTSQALNYLDSKSRSSIFKLGEL